MNKFIILLFLVIVVYIISMNRINSIPNPKPTPDNSGLVKPEHKLRDVLNNYSSGDKVSIQGDCGVNMYTRYLIPVDIKQYFTKLLNQIFKGVYDITHHLFIVQEINNIYEQLDGRGNARYIVDGKLHSNNNHYTVNVILDIVKLNNEVYVNYITTNHASNNHIINRFDMVYQDQGILNQVDTFTENIRALLDNKYLEMNRLIDVNTATNSNYSLDSVFSLKSLKSRYYPATVSNSTIKNMNMKGVDGLMENYFPPDLSTISSQQYCQKLDGQACVFDHYNTATEYTQPYMVPGLFYDRSSYPIN